MRTLSNGYVWVKAPKDFPGSTYHNGKYCLEHHLVYWQKHGVVPNKRQEIHHRNEVRSDNRPSNLRLVDRTKHRRKHGLEQAKEWDAKRKHGTTTMYRHGCRCVKCKRSNATYMQSYYVRKQRGVVKR